MGVEGSVVYGYSREVEIVAVMQQHVHLLLCLAYSLCPVREILTIFFGITRDKVPRLFSAFFVYLSRSLRATAIQGGVEERARKSYKD